MNINKVWTDSEDSIVKNHYETMEKKVLLELLPNRTWDAIQLRGKRKFNLNREKFRKQFGNNHKKGKKHPYKPRFDNRKEKCEYISTRGYKYIKNKDYLEISNGWEMYRPEHILVVEKNIGRKLNRTKNGKGEGVHHIDGDKLNNKLENLFLYSDEKEHSKIHQSLENIAYFLVKEGKILFNNITKTYELHEQ